MKTMSTQCPLCGRGFAKGEAIATAVVRLPFGVVGASFHESCFRGDEQGAKAILREAVSMATSLVGSMSSPTPPVVH